MRTPTRHASSRPSSSTPGRRPTGGLGLGKGGAGVVSSPSRGRRGGSEMTIDPALLEEDGMEEDADAEEDEDGGSEAEEGSTPGLSRRLPKPPKNAFLPQSKSAPRLNGHLSIASQMKLKSKGKGKAIDTSSMVDGRAVKGKKKVEIDIWCSFCAGTADHNPQGVPEKMLSCTMCGRSGHLSCLRMESPKLKYMVWTYEWRCIECKTCEVCEIKGDDKKLMFCDGCDRGYHSYCLKPPLAVLPKGSWECTTCRHLPSNPGSSLQSSKSAPNLVQSSHKKGKDRANDISSHSLNSTPVRGRPKGSKTMHRSTQDDDYDEPHPRIKIKANYKRQSSKARFISEEVMPNVKIRLKVPGRHARSTVEVESEEEKVPYGGIITGTDAETSKTAITEADKGAFEKSRKAAEAKLGGPSSLIPDEVSNPGSPAPSQLSISGKPNGNGSYFPSSNFLSGGKLSTPVNNSRSLRDRILQQSLQPTPGDVTPGTPGTPYIPAAATGSSQKIKMVRFGAFEIDTWFSAPYPEEYQQVPDGRLWLCEFCLKYMKSGFVAGRHRTKCKARHPPGDEIYRDGNISVFEVDGRKNKIYCQNLCLFAKMFLDSKTLYYDVEPFLFYVMTEVDDLGARFVGYFSKEKRSLDNNVSCIMTLPVRQRKGWGQLLIDFSYLLSKKEGRVGGPERPLSGLGEVTYKKYWSLAVMRYLVNCNISPTLEDVSAETSMTLEDIFNTLKYESMITVLDTPPRETPPAHTSIYRGRGRGRGRARTLANRRQKDSATPGQTDKDDAKVVLPERYEITWDTEYIEIVLQKTENRGFHTLKPERLKYHPFLVSRNPAKPPGALARATLMANNPNRARASDAARQPVNRDATDTPLESKNGDVAEVDGVMEVDGEEQVVAGEDQATLELVARLVDSPRRTLRKRPASETNGDIEPTRKKLRSSDRLSSPLVNGDARPTRHSTRNGLRGVSYTEPDIDGGVTDEEEEDDPLRLGKGLNGTPRKARQTRSMDVAAVNGNAPVSRNLSETLGGQPETVKGSDLYEDKKGRDGAAGDGAEDANGDVGLEYAEQLDEEREVTEPVEDDGEWEEEDAEGEDYDAEGEDDEEYA